MNNPLNDATSADSGVSSTGAEVAETHSHQGRTSTMHITPKLIDGEEATLAEAYRWLLRKANTAELSKEGAADLIDLATLVGKWRAGQSYDDLGISAVRAIRVAGETAYEIERDDVDDILAEKLREIEHRLAVELDALGKDVIDTESTDGDFFVIEGFTADNRRFRLRIHRDNCQELGASFVEAGWPPARPLTGGPILPESDAEIGIEINGQQFWCPIPEAHQIAADINAAIREAVA